MWEKSSMELNEKDIHENSLVSEFVRQFRQEDDPHSLNAAKRRRKDEDDDDYDDEEEDNYYEEEEEEDNPFDVEPSEDDILEDEFPDEDDDLFEDEDEDSFR